MAKRKIDTDWFYAAIEAKGLGVRSLAAKITSSAGTPLGHARLVRILQGKRPMFLSEFLQLVRLLDLNIEEAGRKSGH